jgi:hypothetical protein
LKSKKPSTRGNRAKSMDSTTAPRLRRKSTTVIAFHPPVRRREKRFSNFSTRPAVSTKRLIPV